MGESGEDAAEVPPTKRRTSDAMRQISSTGHEGGGAGADGTKKVKKCSTFMSYQEK